MLQIESNVQIRIKYRSNRINNKMQLKISLNSRQKDQTKIKQKQKKH